MQKTSVLASHAAAKAILRIFKSTIVILLVCTSWWSTPATASFARHPKYRTQLSLDELVKQQHDWFKQLDHKRERLQRSTTSKQMRQHRHRRQERHPKNNNVWREIADPEEHIDFMSYSNLGGIHVKASHDNLVEKWIYLCKVDSKVLVFNGMEQVKTCRDYFSKKIHPSTRNGGCELEHYWHPWYCKLPKGITSRPKREKVLKRLDDIIKAWDN